VLTVKVQSFFDVPVLRCSGRIVRGYETALLCAAVQQQKRAIILDLTEVEAIDAAGIGLLVTLQAAGFYLTLMNPTAQVRDTLRVTKLDSIFEITGLLSPEAQVGGIPVNA
jgi:anti-anti-sigma factor